MALKPGDKSNFETLKIAASNNDLALMECKDAQTGEYVAVICMVEHGGDDDDFNFVPVAKLFASNPYHEVIPPQ